MTRNRKALAIIPARGGSKRMPKKNITEFAGKPLIAWTIEAAINTNCFDEIVVSTDSEEIAEISKEYGAWVPFLRSSKADDHSPVSEATLVTISELERMGYSYDVVVQLFAVCPLRDSTDIKNALSYYYECKRPFLLSCFKYTGANPWWAMTLNHENESTWLFEDVKSTRSQDLPDLYAPTGAIWIARINDLKKAGTFYGVGHIFWEMNWQHALDIDTTDDLILAEAIRSLTMNNT